MDQEIQSLAKLRKYGDSPPLLNWAIGNNPALTLELDTDRELRDELMRLRAEHRSIDEQILELEEGGGHNQLMIKRLKKQKLQLKDRMTAIESRLTPDIIA